MDWMEKCFLLWTWRILQMCMFLVVLHVYTEHYTFNKKMFLKEVEAIILS